MEMPRNVARSPSLSAANACLCIPSARYQPAGFLEAWAGYHTTTTLIGSCKCCVQSLLQGKMNGAEFESQNLKEIIIFIFISLRSMTQEKATQSMFINICNTTYLDYKSFVSLQAWSFLSSQSRMKDRSCPPSCEFLISDSASPNLWPGMLQAQPSELGMRELALPPASLSSSIQPPPANGDAPQGKEIQQRIAGKTDAVMLYFSVSPDSLSLLSPMTTVPLGERLSVG